MKFVIFSYELLHSSPSCAWSTKLSPTFRKRFSLLVSFPLEQWTLATLGRKLCMSYFLEMFLVVFVGLKHQTLAIICEALLSLVGYFFFVVMSFCNCHSISSPPDIPCFRTWLEAQHSRQVLRTCLPLLGLFPFLVCWVQMFRSWILGLGRLVIINLWVSALFLWILLVFYND